MTDSIDPYPATDRDWTESRARGGARRVDVPAREDLVATVTDEFR